MTPFECYQCYIALKAHLSDGGYDYPTYKGKLKNAAKSWDGRQDQHFFARVAKHQDPYGFLLANVLEGHTSHLNMEEGQDRYLRWSGRQQGLEYHFTQSLGKLVNLNTALHVGLAGEHPPLLTMHVAGTVPPETTTIIASLTKCWDYWNDQMKYDPVWAETRPVVKKYHRLFEWDRPTFKRIVQERLT